MSTSSLDDLLNRLKESISAGNTEQTSTILDELQSRYNEREVTESIRLERVQNLLASEETSDSRRDILSTYQGTQIQTDLIRASILAAVELYLLSPEDASKEEINSKISSLISSEESLENTSSAVSELVTDSSIPPSIRIVTVERPDEQIKPKEPYSFEPTIVNAGDSPATSVTISHESRLSVSPSEINISELGAGEQETVSFEVSSAESGDFNVRFKVSSANANEASQTVPVPVFSRSRTYGSVIDTLSDLISKIKSNGSIPETRISSLVSILESAIGTIEEAITNLEEGNETQANANARRSTVQLGEFLNAFSETSGVSGSFSQTVENNTELAIEQISDTVEVLSINEAIDRNDNGLIDDDEILRAIDLWRSDEAVPGTGGKTIGGTKILELIDAWRKETEVR